MENLFINDLFLWFVVQPIMLLGCYLLFKKISWQALGLFWLINPIVCYLKEILEKLN
jgi:hypothetical protein